MQALEDLKAEVGIIKTDVGAAVGKINSLIDTVAALTAESVTSEQLQAITDELKAAAAPLEALLNPPPTEPVVQPGAVE